MANEYTAQQRATSQKGGTYQPTVVTSHGSTTGYSDIRRKQYIEDKIYQIALPFNFVQYFCSRNKETVDQTFYTHMEDQPLPIFSEVKTAANTSATTVALKAGHGVRVRPYHVYMNDRTKERMLVTAVSGDNVTVIRAYGTTGAVAIKVNDKMRRLGTIMSETQLPGKPQAVKVGHSNNTVQFFSRVTGLSDIARAAGIRGVAEWTKQQRDTKYEYMIDKELQFLYGEFVNDEQGNSPKDSNLSDWRGQTKGVISYLNDSPNANRVSYASGSISLANLGDVLYEINKNRQIDGSTTRSGESKGQKDTMGSYNLLALCGKDGKKALGAVQRSNDSKVHIEVNPGDKEYGFDIMRMTTDFGSIDIVHHLLLDEAFAGHILLLDRSRIKCVQYKDHGVTVRDITPPNAHYKQEEIFSVEGFKLVNPECHGLITIT